MRLLLKSFAGLALLPYAGLVLLLATGAATWSTAGYVVAVGLLLGGLVTLRDPETPPGERPTSRRPRGLTRAGAVSIAAIAVVRTCTASGSDRLHVVRTTSSGAEDASARIVNRLVDEGDVALLGTRVLFAGRMLTDDAEAVAPAMTEAYGAMRREHGATPSAVAATYLGLERPDAADVVVIAPPGPSSSAAVLFLHGYGGNFALPCWQLARAVAPTGALTACPSTRWLGDWWSPDGRATLQRTVDLLHARGVSRIVLAGLSNGGFGASRLAPSMRGTFAGLVLVSGADPEAPPPGVPVLVLHGRYDSMTSSIDAATYAAKHGGRYVGLEAGHFALLVRSAESERAIRAFVAEQLDARAAR